MHPLDEYIQQKIEEALQTHDSIIKEEDAQIIINTIMPMVDKVVAEKIKLHLKILAEYLIESLKTQEENSGDAKNS
jgi:hypothetical protein